MASDAPTVIANRPRPGRAWLRADRGTPTRTTEDLIRATIDFHSAEQHASTFNIDAPPQSPRRRIEPPTHMAVVGSRRARLMVWESKRRVAGIENATDDVYLDGVKIRWSNFETDRRPRSPRTNPPEDGKMRVLPTHFQKPNRASAPTTYRVRFHESLTT